MNQFGRSKELFLAKHNLPHSYFNASIQHEPLKSKILETRQKGKAVQRNIYYRPQNVWVVNEDLLKNTALLSSDICRNLKDKLYASHIEATGPLIKDDEIYGMYTEYMQLIPYAWAEDIPLQKNPLSLLFALEKKAKQTPAYKFNPDARFLSVADKLLELSAEELIQELGALFKHTVSEVRVNQTKYLSAFYNEDIGGPTYDRS